MSIVNQLISFFEGYSQTISCKLNSKNHSKLLVTLDNILAVIVYR